MSSAGAVDKAESSDLTRLADDLSSAIEKAEHKPGQWAQTAQSMGGICCPGAPFDISKPWAKEEPWANFSFKRDSWLAVAAVNALPQLLALIAENERLEAIDNQMILLECNGGTAQAAINLLAERDRLRAEVAGLRTGYEQVKAEVEALRKARVPAGFYRELVALRELRDQAKAYVDGYLLDEVEDLDACVSVDQHLSASALSERLMDAFEAHWDAALGQGEQS